MMQAAAPEIVAADRPRRIRFHDEIGEKSTGRASCADRFIKPECDSELQAFRRGFFVVHHLFM
jgi:hypothetical protein